MLPLLVCLLAALAVHAAALLTATSARIVSGPFPGPMPSGVPVEVRRVAATPVTLAVPVDRREVDPVERRVPAATPLPGPVPSHVARSTAPEPRPQTAPETAVDESMPALPAGPRYYRFSEVDTPAIPELDWNLQASLLDGAGIDRLVFEIYVDERGSVVEAHVLQPTMLDLDVQNELLRLLRATALSPALLSGKAVASVRRIEVDVSTS